MASSLRPWSSTRVAALTAGNRRSATSPIPVKTSRAGITPVLGLQLHSIRAAHPGDSPAPRNRALPSPGRIIQAARDPATM